MACQGNRHLSPQAAGRDASLLYTGIESHEGLTHYGLWDTVVARD